MATSTQASGGCGVVFILWLSLLLLKITGVLSMPWIAVILAPFWLLFAIPLFALLIIFAFASLLIVGVIFFVFLVIPLAIGASILEAMFGG